VLHVGAGRAIQVNGTDVTFEELSERLKRMFAARDDHVLFFDADDETDYGFAVEVLDQARDGGAVTIAPLVEGLTQANAPEAGAPAEAPPGIAAPDAAAPSVP
jgi:biopolymer transport protein ExbD